MVEETEARCPVFNLLRVRPRAQIEVDFAVLLDQQAACAGLGLGLGLEPEAAEADVDDGFGEPAQRHSPA